MRFKIIINILSLTTIALFFSQVLHEATHAIVGLVIGSENVKLSLFAANALQKASASNTEVIFVEGSAAIMNIIVGALSFYIYKKISIDNYFMKYLALMTFAFSFLLGFGYLLIDGFFYSPGASGDFKSILEIFNGSIFFRLVLIALGVAGWLFAYFFVAREIWKFKILDFSRTQITAILMLLPYFFTSITMVILSVINHPIPEGEGVFIVFLQYFFGNSALFTGFFLSRYWLTYNKPDKMIELKPELSLPYLFTAILMWLIMIFVLLPVK